MSTQELVVGDPRSKGGAIMRRSASRVAAMGLALVLAALLAGDRGRAGTVPAAVYGQDPLEVLELKVRPNIIVVLDTSGSMTNNAPETTNTRSGDHPRSKLYQAKRVLRQVIQNNQDIVSFQYGTYTQNSISFNNQGAGANRFHYVTSAMPAPELTVRRALGDDGATNRGLQSWQIIQPQWGTLYFEEDAATDAVCTASLTGLPRFYSQGGPAATPGTLAADLQAAMNGATCTGTGRTNVYAVAYNITTGQFSFSRSTANRPFRIRWDRGPNNVRNALAETSTAIPGWSTGTISTDAPWTLLYRTTGTGTSGTGVNTQWTFTETVASVATTYYQLRSGRLWNGEVIRVQATGAVCGMTFPTAAERTNPPTLTVQRADASCNPIAGSAVFSYGGGAFSRAGDGCRGFRSKSDLVPCDLQSPPAPTQFQLVDAYLELELPFDATGLPRDLTTNGAAYGSAGYSVPDGVPDYLEAQDGSWRTQSIDIAPSGKATGFTPIANSLIDLKGAPDASGACVTNAPPLPGQLDSVTVAATAGACVERGFSKLWNQGQAGATTMAGPAPWQISPIRDHGVCPGGAATCASALRKPKEKTIVLFVTDGDDTCGSRGDASNSTNMDANARRAASASETLYTPIVAGDLASSVQTYVIGFGGAFTAGEPYRLNWIAWGGSGLGQGTPTQPDVNWTTATDTQLRNARAQCATCTDALIAPDAATLATQLQALINQGAQDGDFTAQQSITETVFEYADTVPAPNTKDARWPTPQDSIDPEVSGRYSVLVPTLMVSSFSLPGFKGQVKAYQNVGGSTVMRWSAGDKLQSLVATGRNGDGMIACNTATVSGGGGECGFIQLHANATDATIATSSATIKRRVYSTSRNGVFDFTPATLMAGTANGRTQLWPPEAAMIPANYTSLGSLDVQLGLPTDTPACTLRSPYTSCVDQELADLQAQFKACLGANLPAACTSATALTKLRAARREAREIIYAFMAGATPVPDGAGWKRASANLANLGVTVPQYGLLYKARDWALADSEFATAAIMAPPLRVEPNGTPFVSEYRLYRGGPRDGNQKNTSSSAATQVFKGFGLRNPDSDNTVANDTVDTRLGLKPAMTVAFVPMNDGLHAFRMGPSRWDGSGPCLVAPNPTAVNGQYDCGGEELWNFVPYDQIRSVRLLAQYQPQTRANHVYMLARGVRFADIFVPNQSPGGAVSTMTGVTIDGLSASEDPRLASMKGVWRRVLFFGRGIGGKHLTALDVTGVGPYTARAHEAGGPIPLWNRGNPDTQDGLPTGTLNGYGGDAASDQTDYATMGQTWSMPTVGYIDNTVADYSTARRPSPDGPDFVLFVGSGYGSTPSEGTTLYTLDALSGDVIGAANVETTASTYGLTRGASVPYANAIVANPVGYNYTNFVIGKTVHPAQNKVTRVYVGDLHGRLWKMLSAQPNTVIPVADLGADQPVGVAASLLGLPHTENPNQPPPPGQTPYIFVSTGADSRAGGPFRVFTFRDEGSPTDTTTSGTVDNGDGIITFPPSFHVFNRTYDEGDPIAACGYQVAAVFRGTLQPSVTFDASFDANGQITGQPLGRVFFGGTRLSLPNTEFAPPTPLACGTGVYPCRSQFDSILYLLSAKSGLAAYDMNASGDDAYRIFRDSRIAAIGMQADPDPASGGSRFNPDQGQIRGTPAPPPLPGVPPGQTNATANVVMVREPGRPAPAVRYGTTVCQ